MLFKRDIRENAKEYSQVIILISEKIDLKAKRITRDKKAYDFKKFQYIIKEYPNEQC